MDNLQKSGNNKGMLPFAFSIPSGVAGLCYILGYTD